MSALTRWKVVEFPTELVTETCCACGLLFAMPTRFEQALRDSGDSFYCPAGHKQFYGSNTLQKRLERAEQSAKWERARADSAKREAQRAEMSRRAYKGMLTKTKKRVAAGVCPCCNRTFQNLARHMAGQHPRWAGDLDAVGASTPKEPPHAE